MANICLAEKSVSFEDTGQGNGKWKAKCLQNEVLCFNAVICF